MTWEEWKEYYEKQLDSGLHTKETLQKKYNELKEHEKEWLKHRNCFSYVNSVKALESILGIK